MKKNLFLYTLSVFSVIIMNSCLFEEKDIFDQSPAERLAEQLEASREILIDSDYGWVMDYFHLPTQEGYSILMKFNKDGSVLMATQNRWTSNEFTNSLSLFSLIADHGPVLSFDTYNPCLHIFSEPEDIAGTSENETGRGMEGDYEFILLDSSDELINIKGKKRDIHMEMRRFPIKREKSNGVSVDSLQLTKAWKDYFIKANEMNEYLFGRKDADLRLSGDNFSLSLSKEDTAVLLVESEDAPGLYQEKLHFLTTDYGICLSDTFRIAEHNLRKFYLNEDNSALLDNNNENNRIATEDAITFLSDNDVKYLAYKNDLGGVFYDTFLLMEEEFHSVFSGNRDLRSLGFIKESGKLYFILHTWTNEATFVVPFEIANDKLIIKEFNSDALESEKMNTNARNFYFGTNVYPGIQSLKLMLKKIQGSYTISSYDLFLVNTLNFAKDEDSFLCYTRIK